MAKIEWKFALKELEQGLVWPFYWVYGTEKYKIRSLTQKIKETVLGSGVSGFGSLLSWNENYLDASEVTAEAVLDVATSMSLGGGNPFGCCSGCTSSQES